MSDNTEVKPLSPEERREALLGACQYCRGTGTSLRHDSGVHYETDSPEEHALHWRPVDCSKCGNFRKRALKTIDDLEALRADLVASINESGRLLQRYQEARGAERDRLRKERNELIAALEPLANDWDRLSSDSYIRGLSDKALKTLRSIPNEHTSYDEKVAAELLKRLKGAC